jgi:hypothetical protein
MTIRKVVAVSSNSPPLMKPVFVDGAAGLALAAPALEGGLVPHLRTLSLNVLRAEA